MDWGYNKQNQPPFEEPKQALDWEIIIKKVTLESKNKNHSG